MLARTFFVKILLEDDEASDDAVLEEIAQDIQFLLDQYDVIEVTVKDDDNTDVIPRPL